jgi:hypothetical protein
MSKREIQSALERVESAKRELARIGYAALDPITARAIRELVEREIAPAIETLTYLRDTAND